VKPQPVKPISTYDMPHEIMKVRKVLSGQYQDFKHRNYTEPHRRNYYSFFLIETGFIRHSIDFKPYECKQRNIFFLTPQQVYLVETAGRVSGISIALNPMILNTEEMNLPVIQNIYHNNKLNLSIEEYNYAGSLMQKMLWEYSNRQMYSENLLKSYLTAFLFYLSRLYRQQNKIIDQPETNILAEKFRALIAKYWSTHSNVSDYAQLLYVSSQHLNYIVKKQTGRNAGEWIQEKKILEAKRLLLHSSDSIKEIAFQTGFNDPAYFNRFFKKRSGATPFEFREEIRKKYNNKL
jgi:AraC-like DNA-binding protein